MSTIITIAGIEIRCPWCGRVAICSPVRVLGAADFVETELKQAGGTVRIKWKYIDHGVIVQAAFVYHPRQMERYNFSFVELFEF